MGHVETHGRASLDDPAGICSSNLRSTDSKVSGGKTVAVEDLWCPLQEVGDERHLVFTCPALDHIRLRYRHLFTSRTDTMVQFLWQDDLLAVARFIADCFDHFQSGGDPS